MSTGKFLILDVLQEKAPNNKEGTEVISAQEFIRRGKPISSVTGLISRYCYCARIDQLTGEVKTPTLTVLGDEYIHLQDTSKININQ